MAVTRGYRRISLDTARSGSIVKQTERIEAAEVVAGRDPRVVKWYSDESVSGSKVGFAERPDGARLLADLQPGDRVVVTKIDRAARNVLDLLGIVERIETAGATVHFVDDEINTEGPMGRFVLTIIAAIAELEAGIIAERRKDSLQSFKAQGRHAVGKAPFGFKSVDRTDGRGLTIEPEWDIAEGFDRSPAEMVKDAVRRVLAGEPQDSVRRSLDERASVSAVTRQATRPAGEEGKRPLFEAMSKTGFHKLLHNPRLAGMTPDGEGVVTVEGLPRINPSSALLTMTEWRVLQNYLSKPDKAWSRTDGIGAALSCGVCGGRLYKNVAKRKNLSTGAGHDTYVCSKVKHGEGRSAPSIMCHKADEYVEQTFLDLFGERRALVASVVDEDATRLEAMSVAQVQLDEAQRRYSAATTDDEESEALGAQRSAKRALRDAQDLPSERVLAVEDSGRTVAEVWSAAGPQERVRLLSRAGRWILNFGRGPVGERIVLERDELLDELLTHKIGSASERHVDSKGLLL